MKISTVLFAVAFALLAVPSAAQETTVVTESSPPEAKLAAVEANSDKVMSTVVKSYASYLDYLEPLCEQPRTQIAEIAMGAGDTLRTEYGKSMSYLKILELGANMMFESGLKDQDCVQTFSLLVIVLGGS